MNESRENGGLWVRAVVGTRAVLLAMDATPAVREGLLGFAIGKRDVDGRINWLRGFKFFEEVDLDPIPGERRSTYFHPIQSFLWGDYSVLPDTEIEYVVCAVRGQPTALLHGPEVELKVRTQSETTGEQSVFFNRGAIPSQAFADRFGGEGPTEEELLDPTHEKVRWLSRGLLEAALAFIAQANSAKFELRVAAYEFYYEPILVALKTAAVLGVQVRISFDGGDKRRNGSIKATTTSLANQEAIQRVGLESISNLTLYPRTLYGSIPHNKFILLLKEGRPIQVWTGSTNLTSSGFLGQSNVGHVVRREDIARQYNRYWEALAKDLPTTPFKRKVMDISPDPGDVLAPEPTVIFSPRRSGMMTWYARHLGEARECVMFTAAFGVAPQLAEKFAEDKDFLRFVLMERKDRNAKEQAQLESDKDTIIALGTSLNRETIRLGLPGHQLDQWFKREEHFRKRGHIFYVHTKYMLIDCLGDDPKVFTGSANFSDNSVERNDENMLLLRGASAMTVAHIYTVEFHRLFNHFYFRTVALRRAEAQRSSGRQTRRVAVLDSSDRWVRRHFREGSFHDRRRRMFKVRGTT